MIITRPGGLPLNFLRPISSARRLNSPDVERKKPPAIGVKASPPPASFAGAGDLEQQGAEGRAMDS
jgi:hypothetical protein